MLEAYEINFPCSMTLSFHKAFLGEFINGSRHSGMHDEVVKGECAPENHFLGALH